MRHHNRPLLALGIFVLFLLPGACLSGQAPPVNPEISPAPSLSPTSEPVSPQGPTLPLPPPKPPVISGPMKEPGYIVPPDKIVLPGQPVDSTTPDKIALPDQNTSPQEIFPARPDPLTDNFTFTLPSGASPLRLSLPADIEDIFYSEHTGIGGFGLHAGGHIEGLDHVWIELKPGTPVKSWADGIVEDIRLSGDIASGEYHVTINYGQNLVGIHMEIETAYVEVGETVKRGQEIGIGQSYGQEMSSAELSLIDLGRSDGVPTGGSGVYVSPYDYLEEPAKLAFIEAYRKQVIEPYLKYGTTTGYTWTFSPYQPYLTNQLFLHEDNRDKLSGEWYLLSSKWGEDLPHDIITFIEADNPYFKGNIVLATEDESQGRLKIKGTFEVDYSKNRLKMTDEDGTIYHAIFEIDESRERARLKFEYRNGSYPDEFSSEAVIYIERSRLSRRQDASELGVRDSR